MGHSTNFPNVHRRDRVMSVLLAWTAITTMGFWLPAVRGAFDGVSYIWSLAAFSGSGLRGDYWFPLFGSAATILMLWSLRRGSRPLGHAMLCGWHLFLAIALTITLLNDPDGFKIYGDTLGVVIDLAVIGPPILWVMALLVLGWVVRDLRRARHTPSIAWTRRDTRDTLLLAALFPVQALLLRMGSDGDILDIAGVLITAIQWFILAFVLAKPVKSEVVGE